MERVNLVKLGLLAVLMSGFVLATSCGDDASRAMPPEETSAQPAEKMEPVKHGAEKENHFAEMDIDKDGKISKDEFNAHAKEEYKNKDKNKDGKITKDECGKFDKLNTDGNDFLSEEEFVKGHAGMFEKMDADKDGFVTQDEMKDMKKAMMKK